ncbi:MAG: iron ABC transporter permease [Muribaculaceae bacterium]|nr:iron ABC transporter permease [Muribaculaceae bacterium]
MKNNQSKYIFWFGLLSLLTIAMFFANIYLGSVPIKACDVSSLLFGDGSGVANSYRFIVMESRLPMSITALLGGAALAASGLLLQTTFRNPLAGPSILGINSGASLGVAFVMLLAGGTLSVGVTSVSGSMAVIAGALIGSGLIMGILLLFSAWLKNSLTVLISGMMVGYLASSIIMLLNYTASAEGLQSYVLWGMGNFNSVTNERLPVFVGVIVIGLVLSVLLVKPLNLFLLGDNYARNLGVNINRLRNLLLLATGILSAGVTAYCGPIAFIGLAVPHIARMIFQTDDHRVLMPGSIIIGASVALVCNIICTVPENVYLPLNGVTPLVGVPVILYVIIKRKIS